MPLCHVIATTPEKSPNLESAVKHSSTSPLTISNLFSRDGQMALQPVEQISLSVCMCVSNFLPEQRGLVSQIRLRHAAVVVMRRGLSLSNHMLDVSEREQRQMKEHTRESK